MDASYAVEVDHLSKSFDEVQALKDITFRVDRGELFGFIGPDGAGKTTLFHLLTTLLTPDEGSALVEGLDIVDDYREIRKLLGYMPGRFSLYPDLSVEENLEFFSTIFNTTIDENYDLIKPIYSQLEPFRNRPAGKLSGGMKQKLALSCALIHRPRVLLLDEPTTGVDAVSRKEFWDMLKMLKSEGITIVVSTPYMDEASMCDRVALIQNGQLLQIDTPQRVVDSFDRPLLAVKSADRYRLITTLREYEHTEAVYPFGEYVHFLDRRSEPDVGELERFLQQEGLQQIDIKAAQVDIEDAFMALMREDNDE